MIGTRLGPLRIAAASVSLLLASHAHGLDDEAEFEARLALHEARADYKGRRYKEGKKQLEAAASACGAKKCSAKTKATMLMELGAFEFRARDKEAAAAHFASARKLAPEVPFTHEGEKDLLAAWKAAGDGGDVQAPAQGDTGDGGDVQPPAEGRAGDESDVQPPAEDDTGDGSAARTPAEDGALEATEPGASPMRKKWARLWLGLSGSFEFFPLPAASDLCRLSPSGAPVNDVGAYCTSPDGTDFPSRSNPADNDRLAPGAAGKLPSGLTPGNVRLLLALDYTVLPTVQIGARLGYALNTYPGREAPGGFPVIARNLHFELRGTYLFGAGATGATGFVPLAFLAAGASEFDGHIRSSVSLVGVAGRQPVTIWVVRGPWFLAAGVGARYLFSPRVAFTAALRLNSVFGEASPGLVPGPELGVSYGF